MQAGVSFGNGSPGPVNFGLDGGRTLQLGGTSTATSASNGAIVTIDLNATNPNSGLSDAGSGTLTILSGATFNDETTTTTGLLIQASSHRQRRHGCQRGGEQRRHLPEVGLGDDFDDLHAVQQHQHGGRRERDVEPVGRRHRCWGDLQRPRHGQFQRRHTHAGCRLEHPGQRHVQRRCRPR